MHVESLRTSAPQENVILACLSPSPSNQRVLRSAAKMLKSAGGKGIAVYVGRNTRTMETNSQLAENIRCAKEHGFEVITAESSDIPLTISEYAKRAGVTDLFLGYSAPSHILFPKKTISEKLMRYLPDTDIHIIPDTLASSYPGMEKDGGQRMPSFRDLLTVIGIMAVATLISILVDRSRFSNANIITIYILGILISSLFTSHQAYGIFAAVLYILLFNFLFIDPRYTLLVYNSGYLVTYLVSVAAGLITSSLTSRMKSIARSSAENAYQANVLLNASNQLEQADDISAIIRIACVQLTHLLNRTVVFCPSEKTDMGYCLYRADDNLPDPDFTEREQEALAWTEDNRHSSGALSSHFPGCRYRYMSVHSERKQYGVIAIDMNNKPFTEFENTILMAIIHEFTMALDRQDMAEERKKTEIAAENERLRAGLLRSISHDLRTPLTSIYGNASTLQANDSMLTAEDRRKIYDDMAEDSQWLIAEMDNTQVMTRLENSMKLNMSTENTEDVIAESLRHIPSHPHHTIRTISPENALYAQMDAKLIMQVLVNLITNALKYTSEGSLITIRTQSSEGNILISVEDNGDGISDEDKPHVFELFFTGKHTLSDSYRSLGLGLNLCRMIMDAHQGTITVRDNTPKGTVFTISLKEMEVPSYEQ